MRTLSLFAFCGLLMIPVDSLAGANGWDKNDDAALGDTRALMLNATARAAAAKEDSGGAAALAQLKAATGGDPAKEQNSYVLGMEVFAKIAKEEGGDMDKIQARLEALQKNPDSLGDLMSADQKAQLRGLASKSK